MAKTVLSTRTFVVFACAGALSWISLLLEPKVEPTTARAAAKEEAPAAEPTSVVKVGTPPVVVRAPRALPQPAASAPAQPELEADPFEPPTDEVKPLRPADAPEPWGELEPERPEPMDHHGYDE